MTNPPPESPLQQISRYLDPALRSKWLLAVAFGIGLIGLGAILTGGPHNAGRRIRYVPVTRNIASGRVLVKPADRVEYRIGITPDMLNAQVIGSFTSYGGSNNTVLAALLPTTEYDSWIQGNDAKAYYSSGGQKSEDKFAVRLDAGEYSFAISNRTSKKAMKFVYLDVELIYYRAERY